MKKDLQAIKSRLSSLRVKLEKLAENVDNGKQTITKKTAANKKVVRKKRTTIKKTVGDKPIDAKEAGIIEDNGDGSDIE